jgi:hypothetical protein
MAKRELTGITQEEIYEQKADFLQRHPDKTEEDFENWRCLRKINFQPDFYDGEQRFCPKYTLKGENGERSTFCDTHGGWEDTSHLAEAGKETRAKEGNTKAVKHGMYAEDSGLKDEFSETDEQLYDMIMSWAESRGWEKGSPEYLLLEDFALSKVREMRAEKYLNENGEIVERREFIEALGEFETYEETHELKGDLRLQKKTVLDMMKELGLTPKAKSQMDSSKTEASAMEQIADVASEAIGNDEQYDPERFNE